MEHDKMKDITGALEIRNLHKEYINGKDKNVVLHDLNLKIRHGEFVCILGPSGCGKSTLIRCISGFEDYDGEIFLNSNLVKSPGVDRVMVFQDFNQLFPWKTVEKNIQYPLKVQGIRTKSEMKEISDKMLKMVDLDGKQGAYPHELSGGMKQRVAIARALAINPQLVLMDEPFAALDAMTRTNLQEELLKIYSKKNITIIFITHNIQEAIVLGSRILLMNREGKIIIDEPNTLEYPRTPLTKGYAEVWEQFSTALKNENTKRS